MKFILPILLVVFLAGCANFSKERSGQVNPWECGSISGPTSLWCPDGD